jgi:Asp-tRNA(Asn)/Glu-tRNA(Gln) amidotransferase A subunit family amidase
VTQEAFGGLVEALGESVEPLELGPSFEDIIDLHRTVMEVEMAHNLRRDYDQARNKLSDPLRQIIERGRKRLAADYCAAVARIASFNDALDSVFSEYDAILTPAAPGPAPRGLQSTGNPIFCTIWTYLGTPALSLPLIQSEAGMPIGVQLVGRRGGDARLLRTARSLVKTLAKTKGRRAANAREAAPKPASPRATRRRTP